MTPYQESIARLFPELDPRHVEGYMRLEYGVLDGLSRQQFDRSARESAQAVRLDPTQAEQLARSYGL